MTIRNTSKMDTADMLGFMVGAMGGDTSAPILAHEAQGQREAVNSTLLPTSTHNADEEFEALGFRLGSVIADDPMWRKAMIPKGWTREGSEHAMWSYVIDADGYRRVAIFYKAAFYDRRADMHIERLPKTAAQADAWESASPDDRELWTHGADRRDGDNYVYVWNGRYGDAAPEGKHAYSDDGRRLEFTVAPDGTILGRSTFETEPTEDRW